MLHDPPGGSVTSSQCCDALNSGVDGAPPAMWTRKGSVPVLVSVTATVRVLPTLTWPKSIAVVEIAIGVSTAFAAGTLARMATIPHTKVESHRDGTEFRQDMRRV